MFDADGVRGPPNLSIYLRNNCKVARQSAEGFRNYDVSKILASKREEKRKNMIQQGTSWPNISKIISGMGNELNINLSCYLRDIMEVARVTSPEVDMRNDIALLLFENMRHESVLSNLRRSKIANVIGEVKTSVIDRAHKAVFHIVDIIGKEELNEALENLAKEKENIPMFGEHIKVGPILQEPALPREVKLLSFVKKKRKNIDAGLNFEDFEVKESKLDEPQPINGYKKKDEEYDRSWLEAEMLKYYADTGIVSEMANGTLSLLLGSKSNAELENELFDFLGFDRFELIGSILSHRDEIMKCVPGKESKLSSMKSECGRIASLQQERPTYGTQVVVFSETEKQCLKQARKDEKRMMKCIKNIGDGDDHDVNTNFEDLRAKRERALLDATISHTMKSSNRSMQSVLQLPFVFDSYAKAKMAAGFIAGNKMTIPENAKRSSDTIKEVVEIPSVCSAPPSVGDNFIPISELDKIGQIAFRNCKTLNRIQTVVFPSAYHSNENLLICAPTGAGKTNIAMLTVVHQIRQHMENDVIEKNKFKVVYVAPMKALAAEMAKSFRQKLEPLGLLVRELTGDMHLTKQEIMETSMIITTPEKWDVTTRKPGDTQLSQLVKLLIIDEVHLLHGDRGPVLETLVARTLRMVESQQSMIRIVGLSATLPNYIDIATFLRVNPYKGLFYFDGRFRPVPLNLTFIGVKALSRSKQFEDMDRIAFDKTLDFVSKGHQVMIFVHARNGTLKTAQSIIKFAQETGTVEYFRANLEMNVGNARKEFQKSRNKKLVELFDYGVGVHHAGLLRQDRNLIESMFSRGLISVLCTTATLAWGVNLPAHAVIIKGTDIYDAKQGAMVDLGILDVLQIFGRAGRPQFDKTGHGTIITGYDKLSHYLSLLTNQFPIESSFIKHLSDNLNAEIALGNVTNIDEIVEWMSYTYLYVRMRKNPQVYGLNYVSVQGDPNLEVYRKELAVASARSLDKAHMIRFDEATGYVHITDLGRIASQFYIKYDSVEIFNESLIQIMNESDILGLVSKSSEFSQIKVRDEEMVELDKLHPQCEVAALGGAENVHGKVNILLQSYISRLYVDGFSLVSDMNYVTENSVRITRALFEIVLHRGWPLLSARFLAMAKMLEHRIWDFECPLKQFRKLSPEILMKIEEKRLTIERMRDMDALEIGKLIRHERMGKEVLAAAWQFPLLNLESVIQPITRSVLRVKLDIIPDFNWNDKIHDKQEKFWVWVEDPINNHMYHHEQFILTKKQVVRNETQQLVFTIPIFEPLPSQYYVRAVSDKWLGCDSSCAISFEQLILPERHPPNTDLLNLEPLPVTALNNSKLEKLYSFDHFNPIQTQVFHTLYHTDSNVLLGAPTGSGKTVAAEIAFFRVFREEPDAKVVYIAPLKALVRERVDDWRVRLGKMLNKIVVELTGDVTPDIKAIQDSHVIITTPEKWDGISRSWQTRSYVKKVALIVIDEIHLLGEDRGPVLEVIVSRTNFISNHTQKKLRIIGLSTALANAKDLADWLGIGEMGLFNFRPSVRPIPLEVHISGFPGKHYCPRMATMNKPTFQAIRTHSPDKPVLVFVSSRRQTRLTAIDLMGFIVTEADPKQWLNMPDHEMDQILNSIKDENLRLCLSFGIGLHHAGLVDKERRIVEELFVNRKIQVLITTSTLAWGVNFPAHLVVVKGTEYFDGKTKRYVDFPITDVLQMMGRAGRPQYDDTGVAVILVQDQKKHFYKKFLYEPFPVESSLLAVLADHLNAEIVAGTINTKQEALDYLTWTYFFRRLAQNPSYYELDLLEKDHNNQTNEYLSKIIDKALNELSDSYCLEVEEDNRTISASPLGRIGSFYYLSHNTIRLLRENLDPHASLEDLMTLMTQVHEYSEIPVRHNEENLNEELAKRCPLEVNSFTYDSPHTKAHLLLQSHMSRLQLPCVDYLTDTKSVLDQAIRILQAMLDVCACAGWLSAGLKIQTLMQMLTQARWHHDPTILILPHLTHDMLYCIEHKKRTINALPELMQLVNNNYETLASMLREELEERQIENVFECLQQMPMVNVNVTIHGTTEKESNSEKIFEMPVNIECCNNKYDLSPNYEWIGVKSDREYSLVVLLHRLRSGKDFRVHAPKFPKSKQEGWFLILGEANSGELLALKRVPPIRGKARHSLTFRTPMEAGRAVLSLYISSDSYLGLDQQYDIPLEVSQSSGDKMKPIMAADLDKWLPSACNPSMVPKKTGMKKAKNELDDLSIFPELSPSSKNRKDKGAEK